MVRNVYHSYVFARLVAWQKPFKILLSDMWTQQAQNVTLASSWRGTPLVLAMGVYDDTAIEGICSRLRVTWWRWSVSTFSWCSNFNISCCCSTHCHGFLWKSMWALLNFPCFVLWCCICQQVRYWCRIPFRDLPAIPASTCWAVANQGWPKLITFIQCLCMLWSTQYTWPWLQSQSFVQMLLTTMMRWAWINRPPIPGSTSTSQRSSLRISWWRWKAPSPMKSTRWQSATSRTVSTAVGLQ